MAEPRPGSITTPEQFKQALEYVATQAKALLKTVTGEHLPLYSVRLFAHSDEEYQQLQYFAYSLGQLSPVQPGSGLYVDCDLRLAGEAVTKIGIRPPDPERPEAGHADFTAQDYDAFVAMHNRPETGLTRLLPGRETKLFEMRHPKFDVLAYVVNAA